MISCFNSFYHAFGLSFVCLLLFCQMYSLSQSLVFVTIPVFLFLLFFVVVFFLGGGGEGWGRGAEGLLVLVTDQVHISSLVFAVVQIFIWSPVSVAIQVHT